jgi:hypothetical protein
MESVTGTELPLGVTVAEGEKLAEVIGGRFDAVSVTAFGKLPFDGAKVKLKLAGFPAETVAELAAGVTW